MDIVVQHVQTWWTKASRGGAGAARRNRVPVAYPLPLGTPVHVVTHREADGFSPVHEAREFTVTGERMRVADLALARDGVRLRVELRPSAHGQPRRHSRPPAARLDPGQWLRWQINYRFVGFSGGEWHYRLDTFSVAFGQVKANVFLGEPSRWVDELATLR